MDSHRPPHHSRHPPVHASRRCPPNRRRRNGCARNRLRQLHRRRPQRRRPGLPPHPPVQRGHHPGLLQRHQATARHHLRKRQSRRTRRQGPQLPARQLLQRHPQLHLARLIGTAAPDQPLFLSRSALFVIPQRSGGICCQPLRPTHPSRQKPSFRPKLLTALS